MRPVLAAFAAMCVLGGWSCAGGAEEADAEREAARLRLPQQIVGLQVGAEKLGTGLEKIDRPYVDTVALFSLREEELLKASLQVNRFNRAARPGDRDFQQTIVGTIGGSSPSRVRVGEEEVYATTASDQDVFTWFDGDGMFVLAVQKDFAFPRTLLRRIVELDLNL